jgi:hypothetical protein
MMTNNEAELRQKILECLVDFGNAVQGDPYYSITASDIDKEELDEIMHLITEQTRKAEQVDRIEVIDETGRVYVKGSIYGTPVKVELDYQDEGRTLKVFVEALKPHHKAEE